MKPGDTVEVEIDGIGVLRNQVKWHLSIRTPGKALMRVSRSWSTNFSCAVGERKDGAMSAFSESDSLLYASGYIPFLRTYPGARLLRREREKPGAENDSYHLRIERTFP